VDGGIVDQVKISDIVMDGVQTPIFIKLGDRRRYNEVPGQLKNVQINNIVARNASLISSSITGFPDHCIENVSISNVRITYQGGGTRKHHEYEPPENEKGYPENRMFGHYLPAYGFFIRHVKSLLLHNIHLSLAEPDYRSVVRMDDVEDIKISGMQADNPGPEVPVFEISRGKDIIISGTWDWETHGEFLSLDEASSGILLMNNDLSGFSRIAKPSSMQRVTLVNNVE
jgi:hypothetical protein